MRRTDDKRLKGRWPEFARMSLRPGIGFNALWEVADVLLRYNLEDDRVPVSARIGKRLMPYGRYLRRKLRELVGQDVDIKEVFDDEEVQALWDSAKAASPIGEVRRLYFKNALEDAAAPRLAQMAARMKIHKRREVL